MGIFFVTIDYPQAYKETIMNECCGRTHFLDSYETVRLVIEDALDGSLCSMKIKLQNIVSNLCIDLNFAAFRELIIKLKDICNVNIRHPNALNRLNDYVMVSLGVHYNYRTYYNAIVLDEECVRKLIHINDIFTL